MKAVEINLPGRCLQKSVHAIDEHGMTQDLCIAGENPLAIYLNKREIVTVMTLGSQPIELVLGYLRNQKFIHHYDDVDSIYVDWDINAAVVTTHKEATDIDQRLKNKTVTSGCGQGTLYGNLMAELAEIALPKTTIRQSEIYNLSRKLSQINVAYKKVGAVHSCAICTKTDVVAFNEDVGRHNAVDTLAGKMWIDNISPAEKIFYTTGRLTSEMVMKVAQIGISVLLSRSGATEMGLSLAQELGITLIARAKGRHFLVFNGGERVIFDRLQDQQTTSSSA